MTTSLSALELKNQGNKCFASRLYADAASCYTKAILKNSSVPTYYTNRALCHLKMKHWDQAIQDSRQALEMERSMVKAHFFLGQAYLEKGCIDESINSLSRADELAREQKLNFGDEIHSSLRAAYRRHFSKQEEKRIQEEIELQTYLNILIEKDFEENGTSSSSTEKSSCYREERLSQVNALFSQLDERRRKREVPDYLCGKISFELMRDPVITPSGITYDRRDIEEHLQRVGHFDPVTRATLNQDQLIPNFAMKEVVDAFLEENPWAVDY